MPNIIMADPKGGNPYEFATKLVGATVTEYDDEAVTYVRKYAFAYCASLTSLKIHNAKTIGDSAFNSCSALQTIALPKLTAVNGNNQFASCSALVSADFYSPNAISSYMFSGCTNLSTLVLRKTSVVSLSNTNAFNGTKFKSGGAGGTIYIPKSLYDHLGDGTADDYKAASGWSTVNGYGTITWAKIEGSIYETQYADVTPIPSA